MDPISVAASQGTRLIHSPASFHLPQLPALLGRRRQCRGTAPGCCPGGRSLPVRRGDGSARQPGPQRQPLRVPAVGLAFHQHRPPPRVLLQRAHLAGSQGPSSRRGSCCWGGGGRGAQAALCAPGLPACSGEPARASHQHGTRHKRGAETRRSGGRHLRSTPAAPSICRQRRNPCWRAAQVETGPGGGAAGHLWAGRGGCGGGAGHLIGTTTAAGERADGLSTMFPLLPQQPMQLLLQDE